MINKFDRNAVDIVSRDVQKALVEIAKKHGLKIDNKGGRYDEMSFTPKYQFIASNENGEDKYALHFKGHFGQSYGLQPEWLGKTIKFGNKKFTIEGLAIKKRKWNVRIKSEEGKPSNTTHLEVINQLG